MKPVISLLVPFRADAPEREVIWNWLKSYWECLLPEAEIVMGTDHGRVFSKSNAVNNAAKKARGEIFVILDADAYIHQDVIRHCAARILTAKKNGRKLWFVPYRHIYRLTLEATKKVLYSDPCDPRRFSSPPPPKDVIDSSGSAHGHKFGALIMIMPREAFFLVGCMDKRFRGWGGEDVSFLRALDTLYSRHKNTINDVLHLYHKKIGDDWKTRKWKYQLKPGANEWLGRQYWHATGDPIKMRKLVDEGCKKKSESPLDIFWIFWRFLMKLLLD